MDLQHAELNTATGEGSIWAAGFFDGEGSINIVRQKQQATGKAYHALIVGVSQVDPRPLLYLQEMYGGNLRIRKSRQDKWRDAWIWTCRSQQAEDFLRSVLPYLKVKDAEARIALEFRSIKFKRGNGGGNELLVEQREILKKRLESLRTSA